MAKVDIFSGFLGAGKTTLIKKLINEVYQGEKLVLLKMSLVKLESMVASYRKQALKLLK